MPADVAIHGQVVRKRSEARAIERDPALQLYHVTLDPPDMDKPLGDTDRLIAALSAQHGLPRAVCDISLLPRIQKLLRKADFDVTAVIHHDGDGPPLLLDVRPRGDERLYGVACDIGSTTIACHLVDLVSGRTIASAGTSNPQIRFGEDLMSRVSYVMMNPEGRCRTDRHSVRGAVASLIDRIAGQGAITREDILEAVFVGNPIMHHLFLGLDPTELGQAPFALAVSGAQRLAAS